jgi:alanine dehydrogenase
MLVGVPREVKNHEYRVAITPAGVQELTGRGHRVLLERAAGAGAGLPDEEFVAAGARISADADEVWGAAGLVLKVKEPVPEEYHRLRADQVLFTYLHLAASKECTDALVTAGATAVAYETVRLPDGTLPLLAPMSEVAGRMAPQVGAHYLQRTEGGRGVLLGGVSGVPAGKIAVIGAGVSGMNAATIALGFQAEVMVLDTNLSRLRQIDFTYRGHLQTIMSNAYEVERACLWADLVIGAVLVPGAKAPTLVSNDLVSRMRPGSVLVDIAIDQGGCFADSRPTTHDDPAFGVHESIFYCVANMPGAVPNTSTRALTNVTLPYAVALADQGIAAAVEDPALAAGVNVAAGRVVQPEVAAAHGLSPVALRDVIGELPTPR